MKNNPLVSGLTIIMLCFFLAAFAAGCNNRRERNAVIRLGYIQNDLHHLPAFVALEKGFFRQEGLAVTVAGIFRAGPEEMSAFGAKALDIGYVGQAPATAAVLNRAADLKFIAQVNLEGSSIVVAEKSPYQKLSQLEDKTVAIPGHATMQDFLLRKALKSSNLPVDKLNVMVLKPPEMIQALSRGDIDAFIAWEPYPSLAIKKGSGRVLVSSRRIWQSHPCCVLVADTEFCNKNSLAIGKIQKAHRRACMFINDNRNEAIEIGMQYSGMDKETVSLALSNIIYQPVIAKEKGNEFVDFLKDLNYIRPHNGEKSLSNIYHDLVLSE